MRNRKNAKMNKYLYKEREDDEKRNKNKKKSTSKTMVYTRAERNLHDDLLFVLKPRPNANLIYESIALTIFVAKITNIGPPCWADVSLCTYYRTNER